MYTIRLKNDKYTRPKQLNMFINTTFHESSATLSPDGNILYFVSDREGGFGGRDIWMSRKNNNGDWGKVTNLGNVINTSYNEEGVFMQADGKTLYFSSQGHNSMGGYDIFKTVFDNGKWSVPRNIGYPINTPDDDVFLSITKEGRKGYYSSAKKDGFGDLDIYEITFFESKIQETVLISGKVLDAVTKQPVESDIEIKDKDADLIVSNISSAPDDGNYFVSLPNNKTYNLNVTAPEYITYQETILRGKPLNKTIYLYKKNAIVSKGYVFDSENNKPICEAKVSIRNFENKTIADTLISDCKTGEYHSDVLKGKSYDINVSAPGYMPYNETIPEDKDVNKTYYLDKIKPISKNGFVYDSESRIPVCGAKVTVRNSYSKSIVDSIVSDCKTGEYFSEVPKDKSYDILVTANGYIPYIETVSQNEGVNKIYFIDRIKPIDRNGFVFDSESKMPVCGAKITIRNYNTKFTVDSLVSDCKTGEYHSDIPQDKPYDISIVSPGYIIFNEDIKQGQNVNKIYFIDKIKPIVINGYIFDSESKNPVCGAKITLRNFNSKSVVDSLVSDCKTGEYHSDVPQGKSYDILITSPGYIPFNETIQQDDGVNKIYFIDKLNTVVKNGYVFDIETNKPVCGAKVTIKNFNTKSIEDTLASDCNTGEYHSNVPKCKSYDIIISAPGYIPFNETISKNKDVNKTYYIEKIKTAIEKGKLFDVTTAKAFVLPDILYDFNKYDLKPQYRDSLNELITTMKAFPNIVIELGSHTDTRGSEVYNEKLSYNRAKSVVDYLILKNIEPERMVAKGYGKKVSRVLDKTRFVSGCGKKFTFNKGTIITDEFINSLAGGKCETEAAHQLNRRTEFKVIREDYSPNKVKSNKPVEIDIMK